MGNKVWVKQLDEARLTLTKRDSVRGGRSLKGYFSQIVTMLPLALNFKVVRVITLNISIALVVLI